MPGPFSRVEVTNFPSQGTQTVSGTVSVSNFPATQPVTGTFWPATQPVSGSVSVANFPATQTVAGSVTVSNFPATQPVSGTVSVGNFPTTQAVSGTVTANVTFPASQAVTGTFWQALQPVAKRGGSTIASGQVTAGTAAVRVVAARTNRQDVVIAPTSRVAYYVGPAGVTATTGIPVLDGGAITLETTAEVWVVAASSVQMGFVETFG